MSRHPTTVPYRYNPNRPIETTDLSAQELEHLCPAPAIWIMAYEDCRRRGAQGLEDGCQLAGCCVCGDDREQPCRPWRPTR